MSPETAAGHYPYSQLGGSTCDGSCSFSVFYPSPAISSSAPEKSRLTPLSAYFAYNFHALTNLRAFPCISIKTSILRHGGRGRGYALSDIVPFREFFVFQLAHYWNARSAEA